MIHLTRLNNEKFVLNAVYIEQIQSLPDTTISLINGKKIVVKDNANDVLHQVTSYYQTIGLQQLSSKVGETDE
ncbi:flagellar FlbD family protein [Oceanobacillus sp. 1P07AA]|uniref:flagellar FlbD family protein n=1 Tax=Oceanobacillus sp. 1P07AA TaxID=3132293 RepID=UPI0039A46A7C